MKSIVLLLLLHLSLIIAYSMPTGCEFSTDVGTMGKGTKMERLRLYTMIECQAEMVFRRAPAANYRLSKNSRGRCLLLESASHKFAPRRKYTYIEHAANCKFVSQNGAASVGMFACRKGNGLGLYIYI